jgi:plasmid stabilization system protein ParE
MKIVYAPRALRDVDEILSYIHQRSPRGAHAVSLAIEHTIERCALNPFAAARTNVPNLYRRPLNKYRYTVFYRVLAGQQGIEIARIVHGARVKDLHTLPDDD